MNQNMQRRKAGGGGIRGGSQLARGVVLFVFVHVRKTSVGMFILNYSTYKCLPNVCSR